MIKAVVFDFDGMVYHETTHKFTDRLFLEYPQVNKNKVQEFFSNEFVHCQNGEKDMKKILQDRLAEWNYPGSVEELMEYWFSNGAIDKKILNLIEEFKARGIICILCTNTEKYRFEYMEKNFNLDTVFDLLVCSFEVGVRKPNPKIYEYIIERTSLLPEEILFCDNEQDRVESAEQHGFQGHVYTTFENFKKLFS